MLKRGNKVYAKNVKRLSASELMPIIKNQSDYSAVIYTDGFKTYDGLVNYGYMKHYIESNTEKMNLQMAPIILTEFRTFRITVKSDWRGLEG